MPTKDFDKIEHEAARRAALRELKILDTPPEAAYNDIVKIASIICDVPMALINIADDHRIFVKAQVGLDVKEAPREQTFCTHVVNDQAPVIVSDLSKSERFCDHPQTKEFGARFYAGFPLAVENGAVVGVLCVLDHKPKVLTAVQQEALLTLSRSVVRMLENRKQAEQSKQREQLLQSFFDSSPHVMGTVQITNGEIQTLSMNAAGFELMNTPKDSAISSIEETKKRIEDADAMIEFWRSHYEESKLTGKPSTFEYTHTDRVFGKKTLSAVVNAIDHTVENPIYSFVVMDVTQQRVQKELIQLQKELFESIVTHIPIGITLFGQDFSREWLNPFAEKNFGWTIEDLKDENTFANMFGKRENIEEVLEHLLTANGNWKDFYTRKKGAGLIPTSWCVVKLSGGKRIALGQDISERLRAQALIEDQRVQMVHAGRLSALGEMSAGIAHEINNPLAIIRGILQVMEMQLMKGAITPESLKTHLEKLDNTTNRIAKIISGLRLFAREGSNDPFTKTSVNSLVNDTLDLCKTRFRHNGVDLGVKLPEQDLLLECRTVQISQVLVNIVNNAFDAVATLPEKWVKIEVHSEDSNIVFRVTDSGKGIPDSVRKRMMEPFYTTKPPGKGTGLGLSLSTGILGSHHGSIELDTSSQNTSFVIKLPLKQAEIQAA